MNNSVRLQFGASALMVLAALSLNLSLVCLRFFREVHLEVSPLQVTLLLSLFKYGILLTVMLYLIWKRRIQLPQKGLGSLVLFGFADPLASVSLIVGSLTLPLALNSILGDLHILMTPLLFYFFQTEKNTSPQFLGYSFLGFAGALFFAWPQWAGDREFSVTLLLPLWASLLWCLCGWLSERMSRFPLTYLQALTAFSGLVMSLMLLLGLTDSPLTMGLVIPSLKNGWWILSLALSVVAQWLFIASLASGDVLAALIAAPAYAVFGAVFGFLFFNEAFGWSEWTGFILVLMSIFLFQKAKTSRVVESPPTTLS